MYKLSKTQMENIKYVLRTVRTLVQLSQKDSLIDNGIVDKQKALTRANVMLRDLNLDLENFRWDDSDSCHKCDGMWACGVEASSKDCAWLREAAEKSPEAEIEEVIEKHGSPFVKSMYRMAKEKGFPIEVIKIQTDGEEETGWDN